MDYLNQAFTLFLSLLVEAIPFLLLGVLFSSVLFLFVDERRLIAVMPRQPLLGALCGSLVGFLFPVCECGNVPVARRLLLQGFPPAVAIGFLLAAPTVNPVVIWSTWIAFRDQPELVLLRVIFSLGIATLMGWIFSAQKDLRPLLRPSLARAMVSPMTGQPRASVSPLLLSGTFWLGQSSSVLGMTPALALNPALSLPWIRRLPLLVDNMVQELRELGGMLVIGSAIATVIQVAVPREVIVSLGQGPITSILAMLVMALVVSICSTVDAFFALSFAATFTGGGLLAFLVFGPMIDLKNLGLLLTIFRSRAVLYLLLLAGYLTFVLTLFVNLYVS